MSKAKEPRPGRHSFIRCVSLDVESNEMLMELSAGRPSPYLRRLLAIEFGKRLERLQREKEHAEERRAEA